MSAETLRVVAAVLRDGAGRVLIAQRPAGKPLAGWWEFPGGKIAAGETPEQALARELDEELGVQLTACRPLLQLRHDYGERIVELAVFHAEHHGIPAGREAQAIKWVTLAQLPHVGLLPADQPVIEALERGEAEDAGAFHHEQTR